jgi:predicted nucleotidyltransferase
MMTRRVNTRVLELEVALLDAIEMIEALMGASEARESEDVQRLLEILDKEDES